MTHGMQQEADVALDQLYHPMNVHHRLLVPPAQVGTHLCFKIMQLKHTHSQFGINNVMTRIIKLLLHSHTSGVCRLLCRPWTYLSSSNLNVYRVKDLERLPVTATWKTIQQNKIEHFVKDAVHKGYRLSPFSDPPIKQMTYPFPSASGCSGDLSCSRRQQ